MANRSDFFDAKLPRYLKKMISLIPNLTAAESREMRKLFIKAHAAHVGHKLKRSDAPVDSGSDE